MKILHKFWNFLYFCKTLNDVLRSALQSKVISQARRNSFHDLHVKVQKALMLERNAFLPAFVLQQPVNTFVQHPTWVLIDGPGSLGYHLSVIIYHSAWEQVILIYINCIRTLGPGLPHPIH